jgi:hypothetical protein
LPLVSGPRLAIPGFVSFYSERQEERGRGKMGPRVAGEGGEQLVVLVLVRVVGKSLERFEAVPVPFA